MPRILIIDDDKPMRSMLRQTLERAGYQVQEAANGMEGIKSYRDQPPDLVITDLVMPEKEGIETIVELRKENPPPRIIAISGGGRISAGDYLHIATKLGVQHTLAKPFSRDEILETVRKVIGS